ncbi:MAG: glycoside hydrolase family 88 protein [Bacteroidales bacterium]|nr:glycoside hydrolase family 88 protein [Bacteroidales bacterium]
MNKLLLFTLSLIICLLPLKGQDSVEDNSAYIKVRKIQQAVPIDHFYFVGGFVGNRMYKNYDNYLKKFPIEEHVKFLEERKHRDWDWKKAEQPGKWLESSVFSCELQHDPALQQMVIEYFNRLRESQEPEGYVGATDPDIRTPEKPLRGMDAYELYFLMHAFLTIYEEYNDTAALQTAKNLANYFVKYIGPGKAEFWPSEKHYPENIGQKLSGKQHSDLAGHAIHYSWEGSLLIDPMLRLYELTGNISYLNWSDWVIHNIDKWSGWNSFSKLDSVADGTMKINEIQPYVHSHTFHMNFLGFLRMYQITGDPSYLGKVAGAWDDIAERQMYITGGVSVGEHYERDYIKPLTGKMIETCASMSWMQLSQYLLELTDDPKYADAMEKLLWNNLFAAQTIDGDCNKYNTPPNGDKPKNYYHGPDCCTASGHRLISMLPGFVYTIKGGNTLTVNQYINSEVGVDLPDAGPVNLKVSSAFPTEENLTITVNPEKKQKFTLRLRMPTWCDNPKVYLNGAEMEGVCAGKYYSLDRKWKPGDRIDIELPMELHWVRREHHMNVKDSKPYPAKEDPDPPYALLRGPIVYSADNLYYNGSYYDFPENMMKDVRYILKDPSLLKKVDIKDENILGPAYIVPIQLYTGRCAELMVLPFANTGKWYKDVNEKPDSNSSAYSYAVWLKGVDSSLYCDTALTSISWSEWMMNSVFEKDSLSWWVSVNRYSHWGYMEGVMYKALLDMWKFTGDTGYFNKVKAYADFMIDSNGVINHYKKKSYALDDINAGKILFDIYGRTKDEKYRMAMDSLMSQLETQPRTTEGGYWHKLKYTNQMWLDGIYMASPFIAEYAKEFNKPELFDDVVNQILLISKYTYDSTKRLYYHGWDEKHEQNWANKETGTSACFWGRGMGWFAMALVDVLDYLPEDHPGREAVIANIQQLAKGIKNHRDRETGLWYQVVDQGEREGNYLESSASSMYVYFLFKSVRMGYIDKSYLETALEGYDGLLHHLIRVNNDGTISVTNSCSVAGLGGKGNRDGSFEYYMSERKSNTDPKAIAPFIWAGIEHEMLIKKAMGPNE